MATVVKSLAEEYALGFNITLWSVFKDPKMEVEEAGRRPAPS